MLLLTEQCKRTEVQSIIGKQRYYPNGHDWKTSYQSMTFGKQTITLNAELPNLHEVIKEVGKAQADKVRKDTLKIAPMPALMQDAVSRHNEVVIDERGIHFNRDVEDYYKIYHDNLAGKDWLEANHDKTYDSPTIEITVNEDSFHANGDFKPGMIKDFMSKYTKRVRAGRKAITIDITPD